jgi:hypothetical protein
LKSGGSKFNEKPGSQFGGNQQYVAMLALAEGRLAERDFAAWLRERLRLAPRGEEHESRKPYRAKSRGARRTSARTRPAR